MTTTNRDGTDDAPRRRPKRNRSEPKLYISFLPEGRGGPREDKGSVPLETDVEAHIEERTDCEPGLYRIEKKRSGEFSGEVLFYAKDDADISPRIGDVDDGDVILESGDADVRKIVAATVSATLEARDKHDRSMVGQPDPMDQFRQMRELLKEERESGSSSQQDPIAMFERLVDLQKRLTPEPSQPADTLSAKDRAQLMLVKESGLIPEFMRSMRDMLRAPEDAAEPKGLVEKAMEYLSGWTPYVGPVVAPVLGQKVSDLLSRINVEALAQRIGPRAVQPTAAVTSGAPASESEFVKTIEDSLLDALGVVVDAMTLDTDDSDGQEHLTLAANAVREFVQKNPAVAPSILEGMFAQSSAALVVQLAAQKPEWAYVAKLGNAADFISALKDALSEDPHDASGPKSEIPAIAPSANGVKANASVKS